MTTYKLDQDTPNNFISPFYLDNNKFMYKMVHFINESNYNVMCDIDLQNDTLSIYGTEIKEHMSQMLYDKLRLRPTLGRVYVNCDGACYILVTRKGIFRPIDNVIFDWSCFGVVVPNSAYDVLRKQLQQKDEEYATSNKELKERVTTLEEQLFSSNTENEDLKAKLQIMQDQLSSVEAELQSTEIELDSSSKYITELECRLTSCKNENEDSAKELHKLQNELSSNILELQLTKGKLESSYEKLKQIEEELSACKEETEAKEAEIHSLTMNELQSMKILVEFARENEIDQSIGECYVVKAIEILEDVNVNS